MRKSRIHRKNEIGAQFLGKHNEGLNVVQDFAWKPNDLAKPFNAHALLDAVAKLVDGVNRAN